jgi:hypothetical protein
MNQIITLSKCKNIIFIPDKEKSVEIFTRINDLRDAVLVINGELLAVKNTSTKLTTQFAKLFMQLRKRKIEVIIITKDKLDKRTMHYMMGV